MNYKDAEETICKLREIAAKIKRSDIIKDNDGMADYINHAVYIIQSMIDETN